jgi:hypothetical protein
LSSYTRLDKEVDLFFASLFNDFVTIRESRGDNDFATIRKSRGDRGNPTLTPFSLEKLKR